MKVCGINPNYCNNTNLQNSNSSNTTFEMKDKTYLPKVQKYVTKRLGMQSASNGKNQKGFESFFQNGKNMLIQTIGQIQPKKTEVKTK